MDTKETFKREMTKAGFDVETYRGLPAIRVRYDELEDVLKIVSVECNKDDYKKYWIVYPKI